MQASLNVQQLQLTADIDKMQLNFEDLRSKRKTIQDDLSRLETELREKQREVASVDEAVAERNAALKQIQNLREDRKYLEERVASLKDQEKESKKEIQTTGLNLADLKASIKDVSIEENTVEQLLAKLKSEKSDIQREIDSLKTSLDDVETETSEAKSVRDGLLSELVQMRAEQKAILAKTESSTKNNTELVKRNASLTAAIKKLVEQEQEALAAYSIAKTNLESEQVRLTEASASLALVNAELIATQQRGADIDATQEQLDALKKQLAGVIAALKLKSEALIAKQSELAQATQKQMHYDVLNTEQKRLTAAQTSRLEELTELTKSQEKMRLKLATKIGQDRAIQGSLVNDLEILRAEKNAQALQIESLKKEISSLTRSKAKLEVTIKELSKASDFATASKASNDDALNASNTKLENANIELNQVKLDLASAADELTEIMNRHSQFIVQIEGLKVTAEVIQAKANAAEERVFDAEQAMERQEAQQQALTERNDSLKTELKEIVLQLELVRGDLQEKKAALLKLNSENTKNETSASQLDDQFSVGDVTASSSETAEASSF